MGLDKLLKSAKEDVPTLSEQFSEHLIKKIDERNLLIQPMKKNRLKNVTIFIASILLALISLILINSFLYEVKMNGSLELLNFGNEFLIDFIANLPFDLLIYSIILIAITIFFLHQTDQLKRIAITYISLAVSIFSGLGGTALAHSGINENIQNLELKGEINVPIMHDFYVNRATFQLMHENVIIGKVKEISGNSAVIETPLGEDVLISIPDDIEVESGEFIRLKGVFNSENNFDAEMLQHCKFENFENYYRHHENMQEHHDNMMTNMMM